MPSLEQIDKQVKEIGLVLALLPGRRLIMIGYKIKGNNETIGYEIKGNRWEGGRGEKKHAKK